MIIQNNMSDEHASNPGLSDLLIRIDEEITEELHKQESASVLGSDVELKEIGRHICFSLAGRRLAVPLTLVLEVGELEIVQPLPFLPDWVEGVTNIRGEIVSVTNLAAFFNFTPDRKGSRTFVVIHDGELKTAIIVDRITGTRPLYKKEGIELGNDPEKSIFSGFLSDAAVFLLDDAEQEVALFDAKQLLSSIRI
ncbi:MAG: chemotaxis protein CheW [Candidatus Electrothrix sp. AR4]|nr:chemotaxis protein CheW [Candidatus Electrothrix sp. AR4]